MPPKRETALELSEGCGGEVQAQEERSWEASLALENLSISEVGISLPSDFPITVRTVGELLALFEG
jgi:hypothetical protein